MIRILAILSAALALAVGCSAEEGSGHDMHDQGSQASAMDHGGMEHDAMDHSGGGMEPGEGEMAHSATDGRNLECPVMGGETADSEVFVEYKGKKVYFCCEDCIEKFEKDPDKYFAKAYPDAK